MEPNQEPAPQAQPLTQEELKLMGDSIREADPLRDRPARPAPAPAPEPTPVDPDGPPMKMVIRAGDKPGDPPRHILVPLSAEEITEREAESAAADRKIAAARLRAALDAVEGEYHRHLALGVDYQGENFQIDEASQARITAMVVQAMLSLSPGSSVEWPRGFAWLTVDNTGVEMSATEFIEMAAAVAARVRSLRLAARAIKNQIKRAGDPGEVDISKGWPT